MVASGVKLVENRPWAPPDSFVGSRFAIHAGKKWDQEAADKIEEVIGLELGKDDVVFGAVIATARLVRIISVESPASALPEEQRRWFFGPYGWVLEDVVAVDPPVERRGYQKLWTFDESLLPRVPAGGEYVPEDRTCSSCGESRPVVVQMDDDWRLCSRCYRS